MKLFKWALLFWVVLPTVATISMLQNMVGVPTNLQADALPIKPTCCKNPTVRYFMKIEKLGHECACLDIKDGNQTRYYYFPIRFTPCPYGNSEKPCTLPLITPANDSNSVVGNLYCPLQGSTRQYTKMQIATDIVNSSFNNNIHSLFYGVFTLQAYNSLTIATCAFSIEEIDQYFETIEEIMRQALSDNKFGLLTSNLSAFDNRSFHDRRIPKNSKEYVTALVVRTQVKGIDSKPYDLIIYGYENGKISKAIAFQEKFSQIQLWKDENGQKIESLLVGMLNDKEKLVASVGSDKHDITLANCHRYKNCEASVVSQDPDCVWNSSTQKSEFYIFNETHLETETLVQDVENGDVNLCKMVTGVTQITATTVSVISPLKNCDCNKFETLLEKHDVENKERIRSIESLVNLFNGLLMVVSLLLGLFIGMVCADRGCCKRAHKCEKCRPSPQFENIPLNSTSHLLEDDQKVNS